MEENKKSIEPNNIKQQNIDFKHENETQKESQQVLTNETSTDIKKQQKNASRLPFSYKPPIIEQEKDMDLKIIFKKLLWKMGHYGRIDVKIAEYGDNLTGRKDGISELTDIDVYGFSVQDDFQIQNIIVDCKNGENISPANRLFWIKGVMENLSNSRGYLVMGKKNIPSHLREIANKFNVSLMDGKNIIVMDRIYNLSSIKDLNVFSKEMFFKQDRISEKQLKDLLDYRKYHYWINEDHTNIHNIIRLLTDYSPKLLPTNKNHQIIVMDFIILFTIILFKMCSFIMRTSISDIKGGVILFLYNGEYNLDKYISVLDLIDRIFKTSVNNHEEIRGLLDYKPSFYESLVELTIALLRRPRESKDILRYMDAALYCSIMPQKGRKMTLKDIFEENTNDITIKLVYDIFDFILKNTKINKNMIPREDIYF